jgi:hypothetical protein
VARPRRLPARPRGIPADAAPGLPPLRGPPRHRRTRRCRRHRLWIGPSARTYAGQLDVSPLPEALRAQRRHLAQLRHHHWRQVDDAISQATDTIYRGLSAGAWTPRQLQRLRQLDPGAPRQAPPRAIPSWPYDGPGNPAIEIAIYPDVIRLAARTLRAGDTPA